MDLSNYPITEKKLGVTYCPEQTIIRVWAPTIVNISVALYENSHTPYRKIYPMKKGTDGVFEVIILGDFFAMFYTFIVENTSEVTDPYSVSAGTNGMRSAIIDPSLCSPKNWDTHKRPAPTPPTDAILYELHVRDFSDHPSSGSHSKGLYLSLVESETHYMNYTTLLDHLIDLGITHVHLMPIFDFATVDERLKRPNYNWGYDPYHFNVPQGSYSTDPSDASRRIFELKSMIMALHENGIKVVMDVVYNHTFESLHSNFNVLVPNYYYRMTPDGYFSNGSGCGNEIATENPMVQKFIVDSLSYWAQTYQIDGFRFDLMGLMDQITMKKIVENLHSINPDILIYGEPWTGGLSTLPEKDRVYKGSQYGKGFSLFNDEFRDAIKGDNDGAGRGFIQGNLDMKYRLKIGILGSISFDDTYKGFTSSPCETVNYFNSHDNLILADKIRLSVPGVDEETYTNLNKLAFNILFLSQGIPFIHAGNEFLRDKKGHHNSYNSPIEINAIDWSYKESHYVFYRYVKDLIQFRKNHAVFRMKTGDQIKKRMKIVDQSEHLSFDKNMIIYCLHADKNDPYDCLIVVHNGQFNELILSVSELMAQLPIKVHKMDQIFDVSGARYEPIAIRLVPNQLLKVPRLSSVVYRINYR